MPFVSVVVFAAMAALSLAGCGPSYTADDTTANVIATRNEAKVLGMCAADDAGECTPSRVRAFTSLSYCANARELVAHGATMPEAGVTCTAP